MGEIVWVKRPGIEPRFTYHAKIERLDPRRARTLLIEGLYAIRFTLKPPALQP